MFQLSPWLARNSDFFKFYFDTFIIVYLNLFQLLYFDTFIVASLIWNTVYFDTFIIVSLDALNPPLDDAIYLFT